MYSRIFSGTFLFFSSDKSASFAAALRGGYEHGRGLDLHDHAAAGDLLDGAVERFAALDRRLNLREVLADVQPLLGQEDGALGVVELRTHHLDRIADMIFVGEHDARSQS